MTRKQRHLLTRIIVAAVLFLAGSLLHLPELAEMAVFLVCYVVVGWDIVWKAITNILHGQVFDENFLMTIATIGALILGEHSEGVAVMLFYQVGEWFQSYAVSKSRKSIASLMDIRPDYANIERDGKLVQVDPDEVQIGETIVVKPGERIPLDGTILKGFSTLDTSALTGESMPREVEPGMEVISGCINQTGILNIQTTKEFGESTVAKILDLVENASDKKGRIENFITRFARYYTPVVVFAALALAILPPLITQQPFSTWIYRALTFLVISCPCALVISIPLGLYTARHEGGAADRIIMAVNQVIMAVPPFFSGILITLLFGLILRLFTPGGYVSYTQSVPGFVGYLFFPALAIALPKAAMTVKLLRSCLNAEKRLDYARTAYSRGNSTKEVMYRHLLKNAMIPVITFLGMTLSDMVAGSIVIEQVFNIPGLGRILLTSISNRDYPVVEAIIVLLAFLVIFINFVVDCIYRKVDPRVRVE